MNIVWLTWKDGEHPLAGGAEVVNEQLARRLVADGHKVKFIVGGFEGGKNKEQINGYEVIRLGNRFSIYFKSWRFYCHNKLDEWADLVVDEVNTLPFFAKFYARQPNILFVHQLARQIWFYEMVFPLNMIGYLLEPLYLRLLSDRRVITISGSTKADLVRCGFKPGNISIISEGIQIIPVKPLSKINKYPQPTILSLGAIRPMKRTLHQLQAFEFAKQSIPNLNLVVAGSAEGRYGQRVLKAISKSPYKTDIEYLGKVTPAKKVELMQKSHIIAVTSVKEGWGLIVTEAASQGTPAIVYDVSGLRDSVRDDWSGLIVAQNSPQALAAKIEELLGNVKLYEKFRKNAWQWSKEVNFNTSYNQFKKAIGR